MDGDATAKIVDRDAESALRSVEGSDSIHKTSHQAAPAEEKTQGTGTSAFSKDGSIGRQFTAEGSIGGAADKVGGPFAKDEAIGRNVNPDGEIGGAVDGTLRKPEQLLPLDSANDILSTNKHSMTEVRRGFKQG